MTEDLILGLAWPSVAALALILAFAAFLIAWPAPAPKAGGTEENSSKAGLPPHRAHKRILWWATFTAVTAAILALALRTGGQEPSLIAVRALAASLVLSAVKFFHWTHDDLERPRVIVWCVERLNRDRFYIASLIGFFAMLVFAVGFVAMYMTGKAGRG